MRFYFTLQLLFWTWLLQAQTQLPYTKITTEDGIGLNSDVVLCTYQAENRFIWVGTANGLQRFDGNKFISFGSSTPNNSQPPKARLNKILPAQQKNCLWLFFKTNNEVGIFNTQTYSYQKIDISNINTTTKENNLWRDNKGNVYITVFKVGIFGFDSTTKKFSKANPFNLPKGWAPTAYHFIDTITNSIWLPCSDSGLAVHYYNTKKTYTNKNNTINHPILNVKEIHPAVSEFFIDSKRRYWIFSWHKGQIKRCFNEQGKALTDTIGIGENTGYQELRYFFESRGKVLWIYGNNGLYMFNNKANRFYFTKPQQTTNSSIEYNSIHQIMEDADGGLWLSTDRGLYYTSKVIGNFDVMNINFVNDKSQTEITDILQLNTNEYWLSTWGKGIITLTKNFKKYDANIYKKFLQKSPNNWQAYDQTWCLYQHTDGLVYIGCQQGKYIIHNPKNQQSTFLQLALAEGATIRYIAKAKNNSILFGTQRGHLIAYYNNEFKLLYQCKGIIRKIFIDNENLIWLATEGDGLIVLNENGTNLLQHYKANNSKQSLFQNFATDIEQLSDSIIICAAGAMNFINKKTTSTKFITTDEGLPSNTLMRIRKDHLGYFWMITQNGLCKYNPANNRITPFGKKDGVTLAHLTTEADYLCNEDYVMFAGANGLLFFKQDALSSNKLPPNVVITDFFVDGKYINLDSALNLSLLKLQQNQNSFTINFSCLSYLQNKKLTYYYRMLGVSDKWLLSENFNKVSFSLLPPGKYVFEVYAENIDGIRSEKITTLAIYIKPPFYRTGWFISLALTILLLVFYGFHRLRLNKVIAVEKIRTRVARDLHDDMGSTLSTINILSSMAKAKLQTDATKVSGYLSKITDNAQRMMEAMDDIVWAIKPTNDSMQKLVGRMREFAANVLEAKDINLQFIVSDTVNECKINMEARRDLFLIFKESINNAAKYASCSKVVVSILLESRTLTLIVADDGKGFNINESDTGNGLGNMQKRALGLQAKFNINSQIGKGTSVSVVFPLSAF